MDHYGLIDRVRSGIPLYMGKATQALIETNQLLQQNSHPLNTIRHFEAGTPFEIGSFRITPFLMDHSAFDAYAFLIEAEDRRIVYSGDFRTHGRKPGALKRLLDGAGGGVDALLMEGTMLGRPDLQPETERQLENRIKELATGSPSYVFAMPASSNIDRLVTFYRAAVKSSRVFVVDPYTAILLDRLKSFAGLPHPSIDFPDLKVWFPYGICSRLTGNGHEKEFIRFGRYRITREEMAAHPEKILLMVRPNMRRDIDKLPDISGGLLIYSLWSGYLQTGYTGGFISALEEKEVKIARVHTSGHADRAAMKELITGLAPGVVIPIHTEHPEQYRDLVSGAREVTLSDDKEYELCITRRRG